MSFAVNAIGSTVTLEAFLRVAWGNRNAVTMFVRIEVKREFPVTYAEDFRQDSRYASYFCTFGLF